MALNKKDALRAALLRGEVLTPLVALNKYRCFSLSQRCGEFRKEGLPLKDAFVEGQPYKKYWMEQQMPLALTA